jgi:hypothetical protein
LYLPEFKDIVEIIRGRSKILMFILILVFLFGISSGAFSAVSFYFLDDYQKTSMVNSIFRTISVFVKPIEFFKNREFFKLNFFIFVNNLKASGIHTILGILIIPAFLLMYSQGVTIGLFYGIIGEILISTYKPVELVLIVFVILLELTSLTLASVEGVYLGVSIFSPVKIFKRKISRKRAFIRTIRQTIKLYVFIIVLLLIASAIETLIMFNVSQRSTTSESVFEECGIVFESTSKNSPAEKIGLKSDKAIVKINDQKIHNLTEFAEIINNYLPGDTIKLTNRNGEEYILKLDFPPENLNFTHGFIGINGVQTAWVKKGECKSRE